METYTGTNVPKQLLVIDWKGISDVENERARISEQARSNRETASINRDRLNAATQESQARLALDAGKAADEHTKLGQDIAESKSRMAVSELERKRAELAMSSGTYQAELDAKKSAAMATTLAANTVKEAVDYGSAWESGSMGKALRRGHAEVLGAAAQKDFAGTSSAIDSLASLYNPDAKKAMAGYKGLKDKGFVTPDIIGDLNDIEAEASKSMPVYHTGYYKPVVTKTKTTALEDGKDIDKTVDKVESVEEVFDFQRMRQEMKSPSSLDYRKMAVQGWVSLSANKEQAINEAKKFMSPEDWNALKIPGVTYDPKAKIKMMVDGKEIETTLADQAAAEFDKALSPVSAKSPVAKVDLGSPSDSAGSRLAKKVRSIPDAISSAIDSLPNDESTRSIKDAAKAVPGIVKAMNPYSGLFPTLSSDVARNVWDFGKGLFLSDGTPNVLAKQSARDLTAEDVAELSLIQKNIIRFKELSMSDPADESTTAMAIAKGKAAKDRADKIHKFGIAHVRSLEEAARLQAQSAASKK